VNDSPLANRCGARGFRALARTSASRPRVDPDASRTSPAPALYGGPVARSSPARIRCVAGPSTTHRNTSRPPHPGHACPSTSKTRFRSSAHGMRSDSTLIFPRARELLLPTRLGLQRPVHWRRRGHLLPPRCVRRHGTETTETIRIWRQPRERRFMPLVEKACAPLTARKLTSGRRTLRFEVADRPGAPTKRPAPARRGKQLAWRARGRAERPDASHLGHARPAPKRLSTGDPSPPIGRAPPGSPPRDTCVLDPRQFPLSGAQLGPLRRSSCQ